MLASPQQPLIAYFLRASVYSSIASLGAKVPRFKKARLSFKHPKLIAVLAASLAATMIFGFVCSVYWLVSWGPGTQWGFPNLTLGPFSYFPDLFVIWIASVILFILLEFYYYSRSPRPDDLIRVFKT
jgi:hypothetical protein